MISSSTVKAGKFWKITQGVTSRTTGRDVPGWTVHFTQDRHHSFPKLSEAQAYAVERGASGKWRRVVEHTGVRGRGVTTYYDANDESR